MWAVRRGFAHVALASGALFGVLIAASQPLQAAVDRCAAPPNAIVAENCKPGNADWLISTYSPDIAGYASATSVLRGETLDLFVTTDTATFDLLVYRSGYYGGAGARIVKAVHGVTGGVQPPCFEDGKTGTTTCSNWKVSYALTIPSDWVSGIYLVRLVRPGGDGDNYVQFVVRDDESRSDILYQQSVTTYQAYNNYGGKSL